jgi:hypothetical protein
VLNQSRYRRLLGQLARPLLRHAALIVMVLLTISLVADSASARGGRKRGLGHSDPCTRLVFVQQVIDGVSERLTGPGRVPRGIVRVINRLDRMIDDRCVALNEIQVVGTHNSYHIIPRLDLLQVFFGLDPAALEWEYTRTPLADQFEAQGIRQIELDVFADPEGGLYADRLALSLLGEDVASGEPALDEPGFKVLHVQHADFETTCLTFVACLEQVKAWSDVNPRHVPIMILVEAKDEGFFEPILPTPIFIGAAEFRELEDEIRSVFPEDRIVKPDDVRGDHATLEEAILTDGWPKLGAVRGKVMFGLDNGGKRDEFLDGDPSLVGRLIFPNSLPGQPDAAFVKVNDPTADPTLISDLVRAGYIVRTRGDAGLTQGRTGDTTRSQIALDSGAHFVSTDFPDPSTITSIDPTQPFDPIYQVELPGGQAARCNPVAAPKFCRPAQLE